MKRNPASRAKLKKTNQLIEKLCETFYFAVIKAGIPALMLPKAIISYTIYYTTDAGAASFELPFAAW